MSIEKVNEATALVELGLTIIKIATDAVVAAKAGDDATADELLAKARLDWSTSVSAWEAADDPPPHHPDQ